MIRIGTRSSPLALIQATRVRDALTLIHPSKRIDIIPFTTRGDQTAKSLHDIGGKALFTKELQDALLLHKIDVAVHSLKDVELHDLPLVLGAHLSREVANDVLITRGDVVQNTGDGFPKELSGVFGTCSPRRAAQARIVWPDLSIVDLRGNVGTRLQQVVDGKIDATILAAAGLSRLGLVEDVFAEKYPTLQQTMLPIDVFIPAAGQGVITLECRPEDAQLFKPISDTDTAYCAHIERQFSKYLGGSCRTALGAYVRFVDRDLTAESGREIDVFSFFEGRTQTRTFSVKEDVSREIQAMAESLREVKSARR